MSRTLQLYVRNLPWTVGNTELRNFFQRFGPINNASVQFDKKTGFHLGYGFVRFANRESGESALNEPDLVIDGKKLEINTANSSRFQ